MWRPTRKKGDKGYLGAFFFLSDLLVILWGILTPSLSLSCIFKGEKGICAVNQTKVSSAHKISEEKHWNTTGYPSADPHLMMLILIEGLCLTNWFCSLLKKQGSELFHIFALGRHHCNVAFLWEHLCRLISLTKQRNGTRSLVCCFSSNFAKACQQVQTFRSRKSLIWSWSRHKQHLFSKVFLYLETVN